MSRQLLYRQGRVTAGSALEAAIQALARVGSGEVLRVTLTLVPEMADWWEYGILYVATTEADPPGQVSAS